MNSNQIKNLQKIELDMLKELDKVCRKHNISYFLDSGSLLGTIRHGGFIPWDDDIDIVMLREDYNRFINECKNEFKKPLFLQNAYTDKNYLRGHSQLRNSDTTAIIPSEKEIVDFNQGIFIDIFPLDSSSKFKTLEYIRNRRLKLKMKIMNIKYDNYVPSNKFKKIIRKLLKKMLFKKNIIKDFKKYEKISSNILFKSNRVDKISYYDTIKKYKYFDKNLFKNKIEKKFENIKIFIPKDYDTILTKYYGENYMKPIKKESGHGKLIIKTNESYKDYVRREK